MLVFLDKEVPLILRALCTQILSLVACNLRMIFPFYSGSSKKTIKLRNKSGFMDICRYVILSLNFSEIKIIGIFHCVLGKVELGF